MSETRTCSDKKIQVCRWEVENGFVPTEYSPLKEHKYTVSLTIAYCQSQQDWKSFTRLVVHFKVSCVDFSPYGTILASASVDGNTILWDTTVICPEIKCFVQHSKLN